VNPASHAIAATASCADAIAAAVLGFALGLCVNNGAVPQMRWLLWVVSGH
jgi:hypothetical protein